MTAQLAPIQDDTCVVRNTGSRRGRHLSVTPSTTAARHLHFGRIVLASSDAPATFATGDRETGLICLAGDASIEVTPWRSDRSPRPRPLRRSLRPAGQRRERPSRQ